MEKKISVKTKHLVNIENTKKVMVYLPREEIDMKYDKTHECISVYFDKLFLGHIWVNYD